MNWPTDPPIDTSLHLSKGGSVSTNHKPSNRIELSRLDQVLLNFKWFHMFRPSNPPTHAPNQTPTHGWGSLYRFQIFKRNRNISICSSLIAFLLIWGYPPGGGWGRGWMGHPHAHVHAHTWMHMCTHTCMHVKHGYLYGGGHLQFPNMFILVFCACACMHVHVHMSRDTLCTHIDQVWCAGGGGVPSQMALLCFGPKKVHVFCLWDSLDKKFPVFALDPTRPYLDWQLSRFLTSQLINDPFKFDLKWRPKCKIWLKSQFAKEPSTVEIFEMYP